MRPADAPLELLRVGREVWARSGDTAFTFVPVTQLWHVAAELPAAAVEISPAEAGRLVPLQYRVEPLDQLGGHLDLDRDQQVAARAVQL